MVRKYKLNVKLTSTKYICFITAFFISISCILDLFLSVSCAGRKPLIWATSVFCISFYAKQKKTKHHFLISKLMLLISFYVVKYFLTFYCKIIVYMHAYSNLKVNTM